MKGVADKTLFILRNHSMIKIWLIIDKKVKRKTIFCVNIR